MHFAEISNYLSMAGIQRHGPYLHGQGSQGQIIDIEGGKFREVTRYQVTEVWITYCYDMGLIYC